MPSIHGSNPSFVVDLPIKTSTGDVHHRGVPFPWGSPPKWSNLDVFFGGKSLTTKMDDKNRGTPMETTIKPLQGSTRPGRRINHPFNKWPSWRQWPARWKSSHLRVADVAAQKARILAPANWTPAWWQLDTSGACLWKLGDGNWNHYNRVFVRRLENGNYMKILSCFHVYNTSWLPEVGCLAKSQVKKWMLGWFPSSFSTSIVTSEATFGPNLVRGEAAKGQQSITCCFCRDGDSFPKLILLRPKKPVPSGTIIQLVGIHVRSFADAGVKAAEIFRPSEKKEDPCVVGRRLKSLGNQPRLVERNSRDHVTPHHHRHRHRHCHHRHHHYHVPGSPSPCATMCSHVLSISHSFPYIPIVISTIMNTLLNLLHFSCAHRDPGRVLWQQLNPTLQLFKLNT